jgi:hypothetical protein
MTLRRRSREMRSLVVLTALVLAAAAPAAAGEQIVHFKLLPHSVVAFGEPTSACPAGTKELEISSPDGAAVGTQFVCTQTVTFPDGQTLVEVNTVVWDFGGGDRLFANATATFSFAPDFQTADFAATGTVTGGEGRYAGATGWLKASGPVTFDETFSPHLNVNTIVKLAGS